MNNVVLTPIDTESLINQIAQRTAELIESRRSPQPHQPIDETDLLTPKETAKLLRISIPTLWRWQKKGKVKCYGIAGSRYYKRSELLESLTELK
ncbi:DNA-binding protein [Brumimicrobium salinarum]|uniref:DNA-binding protein n=1 Tax=Brumimicrobium salinarum TaxID=2058658 RepID=A0A2I0R235_9FLAO|nr:helix-turn-helix domain-containing protein [Brumimicrobium salinarum]PKR80637.1 DNA-binding protein [Brumimicrobium salinarum]